MQRENEELQNGIDQQQRLRGEAEKAMRAVEMQVGLSSALERV